MCIQKHSIFASADLRGNLVDFYVELQTGAHIQHFFRTGNKFNQFAAMNIRDIYQVPRPGPEVGGGTTTFIWKKYDGLRLFS